MERYGLLSETSLHVYQKPTWRKSWVACLTCDLQKSWINVLEKHHWWWIVRHYATWGFRKKLSLITQVWFGLGTRWKLVCAYMNHELISNWLFLYLNRSLQSCPHIAGMRLRLWCCILCREKLTGTSRTREAGPHWTVCRMRASGLQSTGIHWTVHMQRSICQKSLQMLVPQPH